MKNSGWTEFGKKLVLECLLLKIISNMYMDKQVINLGSFLLVRHLMGVLMEISTSSSYYSNEDIV